MNSNEVLQKITDDIYQKLSDNGGDTDVKLIIYMDDEFYRELSLELHRSHVQSNQSFELYDNHTIIGYPVFRVNPQYTRKGTVRHPDYEVFIL